MNDAPKVSGDITMRPTRFLTFFEPTESNYLEAVRLYSSIWGGIYNFMLPADTDTAVAEEFSHLNDVDCIVPLHKGDHEHRLAKNKGFTWAGWSNQHPFADREVHRSLGVLDLSFTIKDWSGSRLCYKYNEADALRNIFSYQCGVTEPQASAYDSRVKEHCHEVEVTSDGHISFLNLQRSLVRATATHLGIDYLRGHPTIVSVDPLDVRQLIRLWNTRALGLEVFPWPTGHEARFGPALTEWLANLAGDPDNEPLAIYHKNLTGRATDLRLIEYLDPSSYELKEELIDTIIVHRRVVSPIISRFNERFEVVGLDDNGCFSIPLPRILPPYTKIDDQVNGAVTAVVEIGDSHGLRVGFTLDVPNIPSLSSVVSTHLNHPGSFQRPRYGGQSVSVMASANTVLIRPTGNMYIFSEILKSVNVAASQSESGIFSGHVIQKLGGASSSISNQPAFRAVLHKVARSPLGTNIPQLISEARRYSGDWPRHSFQKDQYPQQVIYALSRMNIIKVHLSLKCPACRNRLTYSPDDLASHITCDFCDRTLPLGLAVAADRKQGWVYRLAGNLSPSRLAETLPIMATVSTLCSSRRPMKQIDPAFAVGLEVQMEAFKCEIDIAFFENSRFYPLLLLGEVKSYQDDIQPNDVDNLLLIQRALIAHGIRAKVLLATLRDSFSATELSSIRSKFTYCDAIDDFRFGKRPNLPLALTGRDLSQGWMDDQHPTNWSSGWTSIDSMAEMSCERNLGLLNSDISAIDDQIYECSFSPAQEPSREVLGSSDS